MHCVFWHLRLPWRGVLALVEGLLLRAVFVPGRKDTVPVCIYAREVSPQGDGWKLIIYVPSNRCSVRP